MDPTVADETQNTLTNFAVFTTYKNDVMNSDFARDIGNIIQNLKNGYNQGTWLNTLNSLATHLIDESNPHQVTMAQLNIDPNYIVDQLYNDYIQTTTSPVTRTEFDTILFSQFQVADSINDPSQYTYVITANLMDQLYVTHNTLASAHPDIQALFETYTTPVPVFLIDTDISGLDIFSVVNGQIEFITNQTVYNDPPAVYAQTLDVSQYITGNQGDILIHVSVDPTNVNEVNFVNLTNSSGTSSINIYKAAGNNFLSADLTLNGVLTPLTSPAISQDIWLSIAYMPSGIGIIFYNPDKTVNSVLGMHLAFDMSTLSLYTQISDTLTVDAIHSFAIYSYVLSDDEIANIMNP
ncbi:unnamed protein product [Sphagnum balticum]